MDEILEKIYEILVKIDEIIEKLDEIQWIHIDKSLALIRISNNIRSFREGILIIDFSLKNRQHFLTHIFL